MHCFHSQFLVDFFPVLENIVFEDHTREVYYSDRSVTGIYFFGVVRCVACFSSIIICVFSSNE